MHNIRREFLFCRSVRELKGVFQRKFPNHWAVNSACHYGNSHVAGPHFEVLDLAANTEDVQNTATAAPDQTSERVLQARLDLEKQSVQLKLVWREPMHSEHSVRTTAIRTKINRFAFTAVLCFLVVPFHEELAFAQQSSSTTPRKRDNSNPSAPPCEARQTVSPFDWKPCKQSKPSSTTTNHGNLHSSSYQLLIGTDVPCSVKVDDSVSKELTPDEPIIVTVNLGEHLVTAVTKDGKDRWSTVIHIEKSRKKVVLITLASVKEAREQEEKAKRGESQSHARAIAEDLERARLRAEQEREAEQRKIAAQRAAEQEAAKRKQIAELKSQIIDLQQQAENDEGEAQEDESRAHDFERGCATIRGLCVNQMFIYTNRSEAQRKREEARELRSQIADLEGQIQRVANE